MQSQFPLVSIVTPSFNSVQFIRETIESVLSQDYPVIEHIVVDGCSTDGTLDVLNQYPHLNWISEPDQGQSDALNKGFRIAKGEIIGWLNADDTYELNAVQIAVQFLADHPDVDLVYSDARVIDEKGCQVGITRSRAFEQNLLLSTNYIKQPTVFMRRKIIDSLEGVNEKLEYVMDWEFWLRVEHNFKMCYIPDKILANFRLIPGTKSYGYMWAFQLETVQVLEEILCHIPYSVLPQKKKYQILAEHRAKYYLARMVRAIQEQDRIMMLRELFSAIHHNKKVVIDRGIWLYIGMGLLGKKIDRLQKYRKQTALEK